MKRPLYLLVGAVTQKDVTAPLRSRRVFATLTPGAAPGRSEGTVQIGPFSGAGPF